MHCSDRMRFHGDAPREVALAGTTAEDLSATLVADPDVQRSIVALHDPDAPPGPRRGPARGGSASAPVSPETRAEWAAIDVSSLRFYRHGTTSMILTGRVAAPARTPRTSAPG